MPKTHEHVLVCPWCEEPIALEFFAGMSSDGNPVHLEQANHKCEKGHVHYTAWEEGW